MNNIWKRSLSMLLALVMVVGMLPVNALATETGEQIVEETQVTEPVAQTEMTEAPTEESTEAPTEPVAETTAATEAPVEETEPVQETKPAEVVFGSASAPAMDSVVEETTEAAEPEETVTVQFGRVVPDVSGLPSDEELFAGYAEGVLYGNDAAVLGTAAYDALADGSNEKIAYAALKPILQKIASGERSSAIITVGTNVDPENQPDAVAAFDGNGLTQDFLDNVMNALLADMPYELYWFDKVSGMSYAVTTYELTHDGGSKSYEYLVTFYFCVAGNYNDGTSVTLSYSDGSSEKLYCGANKGITGAAAAAAAVAETVATDNVSGKSDYEKLVYFKDYICGQVIYDDKAAESGKFSEDDDPWQVIHVFDGDSTTNVVCEGYAKAFQYLCDLTTFENKTIRCYSVTGSLIDGAKTEPHMWNIVTIDGKSYMVDVTNTDKCAKAGYVNFGEEDGCLFLSGTTGSIASGYTFTNKNGNTIQFTYTYTSNGVTDTTSTDTWGSGAGSILNLSETSYEAPAEDGSDVDIGEDNKCGENLTWVYDEDTRTLTISGTGSMADYEASARPWEDHVGAVNTVVIESGVTSIGANAFSSMSFVESVSIPGTVAEIGKNAFDSCWGLTSVVLPEGLTKLSDSAFYSCLNIASLNIPSTVIELGASTFQYCSALKNVTIPGGVTTIGDSCFANSGIAGSLVIPDSVTDMGANAFRDCDGITEVTLGKGLTELKAGVFSYSAGLTSITIPGHIKTIGESAFRYNSLTSVTLEEGVTTIGENAFKDSRDLKEITIPASVTAIGNGAFDYAYMTVTFVGSAPSFAENAFLDAVVTAYYPVDDATWTEDVRQNYGGTITWIGQETEAPVENDLEDLQAAINAAAQVGKLEYWINEDVTLYGELTQPENFVLYSGSGVTITVPSGKELIMPGLSMNDSELIVEGTLNVYGELFINNGSYVKVCQDATLDLYGAAHVGFYKDADQTGYAGVLDVCGTMNVYGYLDVPGENTNSGGVVNVYNTLNIAPDPTVENRCGFLEVSGEVLVGSWGKLNVTVEHLGNGGVWVNPNGSLVLESDDERSATYDITKGSVGYCVNRGSVVKGIEKSDLLGAYFADNAEELEQILAEGPSAGYAAVQMCIPNHSFALNETVMIPEGVKLFIEHYEDQEEVVITVPADVTFRNDGTLIIQSGVTLDILNDGALENNGTIENNGIIRAADKEGIYGNGTMDPEGTVITGEDTLMEEIQEGLDTAAAMGRNEFVLDEELSLSGELTIPEGVNLTVTSMVTVSGELTIKGSGGIYIPEDGALKVTGTTLSLTENVVTTLQGTMNVDADSTLRIVDNAEIEVGSNGKLHVETDANWGEVNWGAIRVYLPNAQVTGTIPVSEMKGIYVLEAPEDLKAAAEAFAEGGSAYGYGGKELTPYVSMTLTESVTIPENVWMNIHVWENSPVVLTIPNGVTLTNNGELDIESTCGIEVQAGGSLVNNGILRNNGGILMAAENCLTNNGTFEGSDPVINTGMTLEQLQAAIDEAVEAGKDEYTLTQNAILYGTLNVPENFELYFNNNTVVVPAGKTLTVNGGFTTNWATLDVDGILDLNGVIFANNGSYVAVDGILNNYGAFHIGFYKEADFEDYAGVLDVIGTMNVIGGYVTLRSQQENAGGVLNVYGTLNVKPNEDGWGGFIENAGYLEIGGAGHLSVELGTEGDGGILVYGTLKAVEGADVYLAECGTVNMVLSNNATVEGIDDELLYATYFPVSSDELKAAANDFASAEYGFEEIIPQASFTLEDNITIPEGTLFQMWAGEEGGFTVAIPDGKTLTNNGEISINADCRLEIQPGGTLVNNGEINLHQFGQLYNGGTISGDPGMDGIYGDGDYMESFMSYADLKAALENAQTDGYGWVHESETRLEGDLEIKVGTREDGSSCKFYLAKYGKIIVPDGCTLTISSPTILQGGEITVESGGTLKIEGNMTVESGLIYIEEGGSVTGSNRDHIEGKITYATDLTPWLGARWLEHDGKSWYENTEAPMDPHAAAGITGYSERYLVFYVNTWDAENMAWVENPVIPTASDSGLYQIHKLSELENENIRDDQQNGQYFVRVDGMGNLNHQEDTISAVCGDVTVEQTFCIYEVELAFFTEPTASVDTIIPGVHFKLSTEEGGNEFYAIFRQSEFTVNDIQWSTYSWDEDYTQFVDGAEYITMEPQGKGVYKFTVNPDYVEYVQHDWKNFNLEVRLTATSSDGKNTRDWRHDVWVDAPDTIEADASIVFDYNRYYIYDGLDYCLKEIHGIDENGEEWWSKVKSDLPEGVSYDLGSNTLTLNNAELQIMQTGTKTLPSNEFTIHLIGENTIINEEGTTVNLFDGMDVTITGDGSLYTKAKNIDVFNLDDGSSLTIEDNVKFTAEIIGDSNGSTALWGSGGDLVVCENATLTTIVPENAVRGGYELTEDSHEYWGIRGFENFTVRGNAEVNTTFINVPNEGSFNLESGTVNIEGLDFVWTDGEKVEYTSEGIFTEAGEINISGGTLNIDVMPDPAEGCTSYFHGISTDYGTVNISRGKVNIKSSGSGMGIKIAAQYNEDGTLSDTVGATLNVFGGDLNFTSTDNAHPVAVYVYAPATADIRGGSFHTDAQLFLLEGDSSWNNAVYEGDGATFVADHLSLEGGTIHMVNGGYVVFGGENSMSGGTIDLDNSYMEVEGYIGIMDGAKVDIDMNIDEVATGEGVENGGYNDFALRVNGYLQVMDNADITIDINTDEELHWDARLNGIQVYGVYEQMGGEVTVNNGNPTCSTFVSFGQTYLRDGILNLNGGRTGMVQAFNNDPNDPEEEWSILQVHGGELNIIGNPDGILVEGPTEFYGGSINITAKNAAVDRDPSAIAVMTTGENSHSYLAIFGGIINLSAYELDDTAGEDTLEGIALYAYDAPINIYGGTVEMDADIAMRIDGGIYMDGEGITFADAEGNPLTLPADGDSHILSYADGTAAKTAVIGVSKTLADFLANTEPDENGRYKVHTNVYVDESMTLEGKIVDIMPGASLTVKNNAVLTIDENSHLVTMGGSVTVENGSMIDNYGILANDGGSMIVNGASGYGHHGDMNTHYHSAVLNNTTGIATKNQRLIGDVENTEQLNTILALAEDYEYVEIWTASGMELKGTISENVKLAVDGQESTAVLNVTEGLTINGDLALGNTILNVAEGAEVVVNYHLGTDPNDSAVIQIDGTLTVSTGANIDLNKASMIVDGTYNIKPNGTIFVNEGSILTVNGTLNNQGYLHIGFYSSSVEEDGFAGKLSINGTVNNDNYLRVGEAGVVNVNGSGKLNVRADETNALWGFLEHRGQMNVLGDVDMGAGMVVSPEGAVTIQSTGSLTNNAELTVEGVVDLEGTATNNGTICVNNDGEFNVQPNGSFINNGDVIYGGTCGDELSWSVKNGILTISGSGAMMNYENAVDVPWNAFADQITKIKIGVNVTSLGTHTFESCTNVTSVVIPRNCGAFYSNTFAYDADLDKYTVELNVYHESTAERLAQEIGIGYTYIHEIVDGECIYGDYSLNDVLTDTNTSVEEKAEELKKTDNESLKTEMENNSEVVDQIEQLEQEILNSEDTDLTVDAEVEAGTSEAVTTVFGNVSSDAIVGAVVNAAETATEVKLVIGDSSEEFVDENDYNTENGVVFSMTLEGVEDASNLDVPVKITLPVPEGIDTSKLKVLHYHDGEVSEVNYTLSADGKEVSFILTGFSDFAMVEETVTEKVTLTASVDSETVVVGTDSIAITITAVNESGEAVIDDALFDGSYMIINEAGELVESVAAALKTVGTYTVTPNYDSSNTAYDVVINSATFTVEYALSIAGANMSLGNELAMNFFVKKADIDTEKNYYIIVTKTYADGRENAVVRYDFADWMDYNATYYGVKFNGVAAKEMADAIYVQVFYADGTAISDVWVDSIRDYAVRMFAKGTDIKKTMYVDMLNYGAAAQTKFNYGTSDLANRTLTDAHQAYATQDVQSVDNRVKGINYYGTNLNLGSNITLNLFFKNIDTSMYAVATFTDHYGNAKEVRIEGSDFYQYNDSVYRIAITEMAVADVKQVVTCTVYNAEGVEVASAQDSVESYIARMSSTDDLYIKILKFATSAYSYFH